jgi:hypothetical protein
MQQLPERQPQGDYTEFSLVHYRRSAKPRALRRESAVWRMIKWITGPVIGALLTRWASGHFP